MLLPLKESAKPFKRWISQCSHGMSNDSNLTEFEADEILSIMQINNIQDIWKWQAIHFVAGEQEKSWQGL